MSRVVSTTSVMKVGIIGHLGGWVGWQLDFLAGEAEDAAFELRVELFRNLWSTRCYRERFVGFRTYKSF